jgi:hypothetical protein
MSEKYLEDRIKQLEEDMEQIKKASWVESFFITPNGSKRGMYPISLYAISKRLDRLMDYFKLKEITDYERTYLVKK